MRHSIATANDKQNTTALSRSAEWAVLLTIAFVALGLRAAYPGGAVVEHFDEGVYASNFWFAGENVAHYPARHLYAPPLLPWLIEWSLILFGSADVAPMLVNLLAGTFTVLAVAWVARSWFGPSAGVATAILAAMSDFHILYSRTALTDVLLCFWMLPAVFAIQRSFATGQLRWMMAAGLATGLAWWTKYNGWLPLAIGLSAAIPWIFVSSIQSRRNDKRNSNTASDETHQKPEPAAITTRPASAGRTAFRWCVVALLACLVWSPVWIELDRYGGYGTVAENHRQYLVGLAGWSGSFLRQWENHLHFEGWLSHASVAVSCLLAAFFVRGRFTWNGRLLCGAGAGMLLTASAVIVGSCTVLALLTAVSLIGYLGSPWFARLRHCDSSASQTVSRGDKSAAQSLAVWLLAAWFVGLLVATPFYQPFPRLTLPWLVAAWLGGGAAIGKGAEWLLRVNATNSRSSRICFSSSILVAVCFFLITLIANGRQITAKGIPAWQTRSGLKRIAANIVADIGEGQPSQSFGDSVIYVYGEPALFYHLRTQGVLASPIATLEFATPQAQRLPQPVYLTTGPHAHRNREFQQEWEQIGERFVLVAEYVYRPNDLVLLNAYPPQALRDAAHKPSEAVRLYRLK